MWNACCDESQLTRTSEGGLRARGLWCVCDNVPKTHWLIYLAMSQAPSLQGGSQDSVGDPAILGVLTVSDRASKGIYSDESGPAILQFFQEALKSE